MPQHYYQYINLTFVSASFDTSSRQSVDIFCPFNVKKIKVNSFAYDINIAPADGTTVQHITSTLHPINPVMGFLTFTEYKSNSLEYTFDNPTFVHGSYNFFKRDSSGNLSNTRNGVVCMLLEFIGE